MSLESALADLKQKYICSEPLYLSELLLPGGEKWLYSKLEELYQPAYDNNYRVLLILDCVDPHDYSDLPGYCITTLQKHASQLDISNSFILLLTSNSTIAQELNQARILYSTDTWPIQHQPVTGLPLSLPDPKIQDTFCVLPWMHLYVGPDGNVLPCCQADHQYPIGNIEKQSIDSIAKSESFNRLRANMIAGVRSKECSRCYYKEDSGIVSGRLISNEKWPHIKIDELNPDGTVDQFNPIYLDIRLSNICNLKCRMCNGYFSSSIAQEEKELFGNDSSIKSNLRLQQRKSKLEEIIEYLPSAEKIYFAGGEPLLAMEHYEILNALIACGNTNLKITYNTNFTTLQYRDVSVLDLWNNFSNIQIGASLDAQGKVAEYIRHGTDWKTIESNLRLVKSQCPHVNFTVTSTVGLLNVASLIDLQKGWHTSGLLDLSKFSMTIMIGPDHLTVCTLPVEQKKRFEILIKNHISWCQENLAYPLANQWEDVLKYMWSNDNSHQLKEFERLTNLMDHHRKESLAQVIPELQNLL